MGAGAGGGAVNPLLYALPVLFLLLVAAVYVLLRVEKQQKEMSARIASVVAPQTAVKELTPRGIMRADEEILTLTDRVGKVFGFSVTKADHYMLPWPAVLAIALAIAVVASMLLSGLIGIIPARLTIPVVWVFLSRTVFARGEAKRKTILLDQFPDTLGLIVRAVRVGIPVTESLRVVAKEAPEPTRSEFFKVADQINIGTAPEHALRDLAARSGLPEYGFFAAALTLQAQTGGGLTDTLELLAEVIRKRVAMKMRGYALSAEARTSSMVLGSLPIVTGLLLTFLNPDYMNLLFTDKTGNLVLGAAVLSLCTGVFVMQTIIRKSLS